tara:strand:- start:2216 stop:3775 length:1560 start_codon:yes stop_codon:yes gene_type:complete
MHTSLITTFLKKGTLLFSILIFSSFFFSFYLESKKCTLLEFQPRSNGAAAMGLGDKTGGPLSGGATCMGCHGGAPGMPNLTMSLKDASGNSVTSYTPGNIYTIDFEVTGGSLFFGFQGVALTSNNWQAGTLTSPVTLNTQITNLVSTSGGLQYAEHLGLSSTGIFSLLWTAPNTGTGDITFYGVGLAADGNGGTSGDHSTLPMSLVINESTSTSIGYAQVFYCQNDIDPTPTINGTTGGTFSSTIGLAIDSGSGAIDLSNSQPGPYLITYTYTGGVASFNIIIEPFFDASFAYANSSYCSSDGMVMPTVTNPIGSFSASPAGLDIATITGFINTTNSQSGQYTVTHIIAGNCADTANQVINITSIDNSVTQNGNALTANQSGASYHWLDCDNNFNAIQGETGQTFSATANGNYAVEVTENACVDTSACINITGIGILENSFGENFSVFPNPTAGNLTINLGGNYENVQLELFSIDGKLLRSQKFKNISEINWLVDYPSGYYFIKVNSLNKKATINILKQ